MTLRPWIAACATGRPAPLRTCWHSTRGLSRDGHARGGEDPFCVADRPSVFDRSGGQSVLVICPTNHLRTQWASAARASGHSIGSGAVE